MSVFWLTHKCFLILHSHTSPPLVHLNYLFRGWCDNGVGCGRLWDAKQGDRRLNISHFQWDEPEVLLEWRGFKASLKQSKQKSKLDLMPPPPPPPPCLLLKMVKLQCWVLLIPHFSHKCILLFSDGQNSPNTLSRLWPHLHKGWGWLQGLSQVRFSFLLSIRLSGRWEVFLLFVFGKSLWFDWIWNLLSKTVKYHICKKHVDWFLFSVE